MLEVGERLEPIGRSGMAGDEHEIPVGRALAAHNDNGPTNGRPPECYAEKDSPQPQLFVALGLLNLN